MQRSLVKSGLQGFGANYHAWVSLVKHLFRAYHVLQYCQDLQKSPGNVRFRLVVIHLKMLFVMLS